MTTASRRRFLRLSTMTGLSAVGVAVPSAQAQQPAPASEAPVLGEKEPQAMALGYVIDASRVDKVKFPKYAPPQRCANCQLYQGPPTAALAPCAIFGGKQVAGPGWCSAWVPRAA